MSTIDVVKTEAEIELMRAATAKTWAEHRKILKESAVIPFIAGAAVATACTAVAALVLKYLSGM